MSHPNDKHFPVFTIPGLNTKIGFSKKLSLAKKTLTGSYFIELFVDKREFDDIFFVKVDPNSIDNTSKYEFCVKSENWPILKFSEGFVSNNKKKDINEYSCAKIVKNIGPAWLASNVTGGHKNSNVFANEGELIEQYSLLDDCSGGIQDLIKNNLSQGGTKDAPLKYKNISVKNVSKDLMNNFKKSKDVNTLNRLRDLLTKRDNDGWSELKFNAGDIIQFSLVYGYKSVAKDGTTINNASKRKLENQDFVVE